MAVREKKGKQEEAEDGRGGRGPQEGRGKGGGARNIRLGDLALLFSSYLSSQNSQGSQT